MKYCVQDLAPAGNYFDVLETNNLKFAKEYADEMCEYGRVVLRKDKPIHQSKESQNAI